MIEEFVAAWESRKTELQTKWLKKLPTTYLDLIKDVVGILPELDTKRVHEIDDGEYQGSLVFVIAKQGYQPSEYWYVTVDYGSCSGCDTLCFLLDEPKEEAVKGFMSLALHIVQKLKKM